MWLKADPCTRTIIIRELPTMCRALIHVLERCESSVSVYEVGTEFENRIPVFSRRHSLYPLKYRSYIYLQNVWMGVPIKRMCLL